MTDQTPPPPPAESPVPEPEKPGRRRGRRLLRVGVVVVCSLLLLLLFLPTLISIAPLEGMISRQASKLFPGKVVVEDVRMGWWAPLSVGRVALVDESIPHDEPSGTLLDVRGVRATRGFVRLLTGSARPGPVHVDRIDVYIARLEWGGFNFEAFIPPGDEEVRKERPPRDEPLVFDLEQLLPRIKLPVGKLALDIQVGEINLVWEDQLEGSPLPRLLLEDGSFYLGWPGGSEALGMRFAGRLTNGEREVPLELAGTLSQWSDGRKLDFSTFRFTGFLDAGGRSNVLDFGASAGEEGLAANLKFSLPALAPLAGLAGFEQYVPNEGEIKGSLAILPTKDGVTGLELAMGMGELALPVYTEAGDPFRVPPVNLSVVAGLDAVKYLPHNASIDLDARWGNFVAQLDEGEGVKRPFDFRGALSLTEILDLVSDSPFGGDLPARGMMEFALEGDGELVDLARVENGRARLSIEAGTWSVSEGLVPPAAMLHRANTLELGSLKGFLELKDLQLAAMEQTGRWEVEWQDVGSLDGAFSHAPDTGYTFDAAWKILLEGLESIVKENMVLKPVLDGLAGTLGGSLALWGEGRNVNLDLLLDLDGFHFRSAFLPTGVLEDDLHLSVRSGIDEHLDIQADWKILTGYTFLEGSFARKNGLIESLKGSVGFSDLLAFQQVWMDPLLPPGLFDLVGGFGLEFDIQQETSEEWKIALNLAPDEAFGLILESHGLAIQDWHLGASLGIGLRGDDLDLDLDLESFSLGFEEAINLNAKGKVSKSDTKVEISIYPEIYFEHGPLLDFAFMVLENAGVMVEELDGRTRIASVIAGNFQLGENFEGGVFVEVGVESHVPIIHVVAPMELLLEDLDVDRTLLVSTRFGEDLVYQVVESGRITLANLMTGFLEGHGILFESNLVLVDKGDIEFDLDGFSWDGFGLYMEGHPPLLVPEGMVATKVRVPASRESVSVGDIVFDLGGGLDLLAGLVYHTPTGSLDLEYTLERLDLTLISEMLAEFLPMELGGVMQMGGQVNLVPGSNGESLIPFSDYRVNVDAEWKEGSIKGDALDIRDFGSVFSLKLDPMEARISLFNDLMLVPPAAEDGNALELPVSTRTVLTARGSADLPLEASATLAIEEFSLASEALGVALDFRAHLEDLHQIARQEGRPSITVTTLGDLLFLLNRLPGQFSLDLRQELAPLARAGYLDDGAGSVALSMGYEMLGDTRATFHYRQEFRNVALRWREALEVDGLSSRIDFERSFFLPGIPTATQKRTLGMVDISRAVYNRPGLSPVIGNGQLVLREDGGRFSLLARAGSLLGATFSMVGEVDERLGSQRLLGDFSLTGMDAALFLPVLQQTQKDRREVDLFGTVRLPFVVRIEEGLQDRNIRMVDFLEDIFVRLDISRVEAEVLRGVLRSMNADGGVPGAQAALAALQFSRPEGVDVELRGGLVNIGVTMASPGGVTYRIPILERLHVGTYFAPSLERASVLTSTLLRDYLLALVSVMEEKL